MGVSNTQWSSFLLFCTLLLFHMDTHLPASFFRSAPLLLIGHILSRHFFAFPSPSHWHACLPIFSLSLSMPRLTGGYKQTFHPHGLFDVIMSHDCHTPCSSAASGLGHLGQWRSNNSWLGCSSAFFTSNNIIFPLCFKTMEVKHVHVHLDGLLSTWFAFSEISDIQNNPPGIRQHLY